METNDQVRAEHLKKLGPKLGPVFFELRNDYFWLRVKWAEYCELYGTSPERINLLNASASRFFGLLHETLWEGALLHLCRLTDPARMGKKQNLSIQALPELCDDPVLKQEVIQLVSRATEATAFARDWRNRRIGHRDLSLALGSGTKPLAPGSRADVSAALSAIHQVLNHIIGRLLKSDLSEEVISPPTGAEALLYVIRDGLEAEAARRERIRTGQFTPDDSKNSPI